MRKLLFVAAVLVAAAPAALADLKPGTPEVKSVSALAFGPGGVMFIGDSQAAAIHAVATGDTQRAGNAEVNVDKLDEKLASMLGVTPKDVTVNDVKVNPASGNVYLAVTRGKGAGAPVILKLSRDGKMDEVKLQNVPTASVSLPNVGDKQRASAITGLAFVDGKVIVAGLSNEEFASTLRAIPYPFQSADKGAGIKIFHGNHGRFETNAPVQTFTSYKIGGADYLVAAYTCTPLVKIPVSDLKAGAKIDGTTIAELGNRNKPLDMVVYNKGGKDYILMANSARGVMKIPTEEFGSSPSITAPVKGMAGPKYETIAELKDVQQLDKLDDGRAVILVKPQGGEASLKTIPLP